MARLRAHNQHVNLYGGQGSLGEVRNNNRPSPRDIRDAERNRPGKTLPKDMKGIGSQAELFDGFALIKLQRRIASSYERRDAAAGVSPVEWCRSAA